MARPKKKNSNPQQSMEELLATTVAEELFRRLNITKVWRINYDKR